MVLILKLNLVNYRMKQDEHKLQVAICKWLDYTQDFYYFSIPNGGLRHRLVAIKLKMEGAKAGVADMFWMVSNDRSEAHTSELQSRFGISYADFCLEERK